MSQSRRFWKIAGSIAFLATGTVTASVYSVVYGNTEQCYNRFILPILHRLDPELSHNLAVKFLRDFYVPPSWYDDPAELACNLSGLAISNPIGLAAGFDKNAEALERLDRFGFSFIEIGSVTPQPQPGNEKPRVFRLPEDKAVINRYGFNSHGHMEVRKKLVIFRNINFKSKTRVGVNLGVNKNSENPTQDYLKGIRVFSDLADYFVINVSSPNTSGLRDLQQKARLDELLSSVIEARDNLKIKSKPLIFLKLSPDLTSEELQDVASVILTKECRIDGLIISNTTVKRDPSLKSPLKSESGGLSGLPLKQRSTELIAEMYKLTKGLIPIIGVGGVFTGEDAFEKIKAGASVVQIYTSFIYHGPPIVEKIKTELVECLRRENYANVTEAVGKAVTF